MSVHPPMRCFRVDQTQNILSHSGAHGADAEKRGNRDSWIECVFKYPTAQREKPEKKTCG
jgi:hypothetical protein